MIGYCRIPRAALAAAMAFVSPATAATAGAPPFARAPDKVIMPRQPDNLKLFTEWGFAAAVIDGDRIYLSGVVAGLRPGESDQALAFDRAFRTIGDVLARSGSSWDREVEMTTYHTDIKAQLDGFVAVKHRYVRAPSRHGPRSMSTGWSPKMVWSRSRSSRAANPELSWV